MSPLLRHLSKILTPNFGGDVCTLTPSYHSVISKIVTQNISTEMTFYNLHIYMIISKKKNAFIVQGKSKTA